MRSWLAGDPSVQALPVTFENTPEVQDELPQLVDMLWPILDKPHPNT